MTSYVRLLEQTLDFLEQGVYIYSPQGRAIYLNKKARQSMGIPEGTPYKGGALLDIVDITQEESTTLSCIREQKEIRNRLCRYKTMDGREHYMFNTATPYGKTESSPLPLILKRMCSCWKSAGN